MASHITTIVNAVAIVCAQAGLGDVPVVTRDMPKIFEGDPIPIVIVSEKRTASRKALTFEGHRRARYQVQITLIAGSNQDHITNKDLYAQWRENLRSDLFGTTDVLTGAPDVDQIEMEDSESHDQSALAVNYAWYGLVVNYWTIE